MSLVRHVVRSAVCIRLTLQQSARLHSVCSRSSLLDTWAQRTPRITSWSVVRCYAAKKKDKDKKKQRDLKLNVSQKELSTEEIDGIIDVEALKKDYQSIIDHLKHEYIHTLALRTSTGTFDQLQIPTEDGTFPLNQLATIVQKNPTLLIIDLAAMPQVKEIEHVRGKTNNLDAHQYIPAVMDTIKNSGTNVNPQQEGTHTIYLPIPKVSREHRENLAKSAKTICNKTKEKLRQVHNKYTKLTAKKEVKAHHPEDLLRNINKLILAELHLYEFEADQLMKAKTKELLGDN